MKKLLLSTLSVLFILVFIIQVQAQAPQAFKYQTVVRDGSGNLITNKKVSFKISILKGSSTGTVSFSETDTATTNSFGLANLNIGQGTIVSGVFKDINWGADTYFTKIEFDKDGGSAYVLMGTSQMLSVPYSQYAQTAKTVEEKPLLSISHDTIGISGGNKIVLPKSATSAEGRTYLVLNGDLTDAEAMQRIKDEAGANTQFIWVQNTNKLTTLNFSGVSNAVDILISNNTSLLNITFPDLKVFWFQCVIHRNNSLTSINMPALTNTPSTNFVIMDNSALTNISLPALSTVNSFSFGGNGVLTTLDLTSLKTASNLNVGYVQGSFKDNKILNNLNLPSLTFGFVNVQSSKALTTLSLPVFGSIGTSSKITINNSGITSLNLPSLDTGNVTLQNDSALTSINMSSLINGNFVIQYNPKLTSMSLTSLTTIGNGNINNNISLTTIDLPSSTAFRGGNLSKNALTSATINNILAKMVAISPILTGSTMKLEGQTPLAPPTGQGITDKATLITNGNNVTTD